MNRKKLFDSIALAIVLFTIAGLLAGAAYVVFLLGAAAQEHRLDLQIYYWAITSVGLRYTIGGLVMAWAFRRVLKKERGKEGSQAVGDPLDGVEPTEKWPR